MVDIKGLGGVKLADKAKAKARTGAMPAAMAALTARSMWPSLQSSWGWRSSVASMHQGQVWSVTAGASAVRSLDWLPWRSMMAMPWASFSRASAAEVHS